MPGINQRVQQLRTAGRPATAPQRAAPAVPAVTKTGRDNPGVMLEEVNTVGDRIDGLAATWSMMEVRARLALICLLTACYELLKNASGDVQIAQELQHELAERGCGPEAALEHALLRAVFRPISREERKRTDKYARSLVALRRKGASVDAARRLLKSPGIEKLADSIAEKRQPEQEPAPISGATEIRYVVSFSADLVAAARADPRSWLQALVLLHGTGGKPMIRLASKRN